MSNYATRRPHRVSYDVPFVGWSQLEAHLAANWQQGQHVALIGKTGSGKSHLALDLLDIKPFVIIVATKRYDPLLEEASRGYVVREDMSEIPRTDEGYPIHNKVIIWPATAIKNEELRLRAQAAAVTSTLSTAERQRYWTVLIDDVMWVYDMLGLNKKLESIWYQARSAGISMVAAAQRPVKTPRNMVAQASHLFLFTVSDKRDLEHFREIAGTVPPALIEQVLPSLDAQRHEFLYVGADDGVICRSIAPPRQNQK
jgi:hypothetical protein